MRMITALIVALMLLLTGCAGADAPVAAEQGFELHVIDVGKADCLLIKSDGLYMLVDTGETDDEDAIRAYLAAQGVSRLEYLVATHPDKDHIGGMPWVLASYGVGQAWICPLPEDSKPYLRMTAALSAEGTEVLCVQAGAVTGAGSGGSYGNCLRVQHPDGSETRYAHLQYLYVRAGEVVAAGQRLGTAGQTGRATGAHLHFELRRGGEAEDPATLLGLAHAP